MRLFRPASAASLLLLMSVSARAQAKKALNPPNVVVEEVGKGSAGEKAGIQPGDVLLTWVRLSKPPTNRAEAQGKFESPFDLGEVEIEQAPRGEVRLTGLRGNKPLSVSVPPTDWRIQARPQMFPPILSGYQEGRRLIAIKEAEEGIAIWRDCARKVQEARKSEIASWLYSKIGNAWADLNTWDEAHAAYQSAILEAKKVSDKNVIAQVWTIEGVAFEKQNDFPKAEAAYREALQFREKKSRRSLSVAKSLNDIGLVLMHRGDLETAQEFFSRALVMTEKLAPGSLAAVASIDSLGMVASRRGDLDTTEDFYKKALAIREKLAPGSLAVATSLDNLGNVARDRGELSAEDLYRRALSIREKLAPGSLDTAASINNLGIVAGDRGDLSAAEGYFRNALVITEKVAPGSLPVAAGLTNVGILADIRGDLSAAETLHKRALAIREKVAPESLDVAATMLNLGIIAIRRNDLNTAEDLCRKALAIREKLAPGSLAVASSLDTLGKIAQARGDSRAAEDCFRKALAISSKDAPESLDVAEYLTSLGNLARFRGDLDAAEDSYGKALAIRKKSAPAGLDEAESLIHIGIVTSKRGNHASAEETYWHAVKIIAKFAPGSVDEAEALHEIGLLYRSMGRPPQAADAFRRAIEALESQKVKLGGSEEVKAGFAAKYADYYKDYIEVLLELNEPGEAFHVLERSRARSLLSLLAERDLVFSSDIPPDLERERKLTDSEYDRTQIQIRELNVQEEVQKVDELLGHLRELRTKQDGIAELIRKASPRLGSLQYPQPLDLAGAQKVLDSGTVLLAYSVGKEKSFLFVVQPGGTKGSGLSVLTLPIGEKPLRESVEAFRNLINWKPSQESSQNLVARSRSLYDALIKPAEKLIDKSDRILILPDGPLYILPFDALVKDVKSAKPQYLIEWKPLHTAVSATVYAELKKERWAVPSSSPVIVAAFGDPKYPKLSQKKVAARRSEDEAHAGEIAQEEDDEAADPEVRSAFRGGYRLDPLPATRLEVESIASLYAPKAVKYLGEDATEERAKSIGKNTPYIHFACHGILNERFPLDSALALTIPEKPKEGQDNGLLQAWEIFEKVRIDADLVTLSACETGLGKEMGGEGLVGLTRAFQYAGARSILASLWKVEDESTGELMKRFYAFLKGGKTKDEALRLAQVELIHSPNLAQPVHWAAFQLIGDWK